MRRALPAVPSSGRSHARATLEPRQPVLAAIRVTETIGATAEASVERLELRPVLVGAAWKVLDLSWKRHSTRLAYRRTSADRRPVRATAVRTRLNSRSS